MASIRIDEPCGENFGAMPKTDMGAYCGRCRFEVIDFTTMTSEEIRGVLRTKKDQRLCGHIGKAQLLELNQDFMDWKQGQLHIKKSLVMALLVVFGMTLFSCGNSDDRRIVQNWRKEVVEWVGKSITENTDTPDEISQPEEGLIGEVCIKPEVDLVDGGIGMDPEYFEHIHDE